MAQRHTFLYRGSKVLCLGDRLVSFEDHLIPIPSGYRYLKGGITDWKDRFLDIKCLRSGKGLSWLATPIGHNIEDFVLVIRPL